MTLVRLSYPLSLNIQIYLNVEYALPGYHRPFKFLILGGTSFCPLPISDRNEILTSLFQARPKIRRPAYFIPDR